ncbi:MAG: 4Fe-4S binding protein [Actinobacteria bacterium]|nr:4Fe-4S binding protein [Actinomycetota bacterium]
MKVAVLSGKGGAGKTLVAVNLAAAANARYVDCDVEEPNGHLFLTPTEVAAEQVTVTVPVVAAANCTGCRKCVDFCRFNALAWVDDEVMVFEEACKSCGGCAVLCPSGAITEERRVIGHVHRGVVNSVEAWGGAIRPGVVSGVPVVQQVLRDLPEDGLTVIDGPPGASCLALETARAADYCLLVAEPTRFGVHNVAMIHQLTVAVDRPCGVVINKATDANTSVEELCAELGLPVLGRIPYDQQVALASSQGEVLAWQDEAQRQVFVDILDRLGAVIGR